MVKKAFKKPAKTESVASIEQLTAFIFPETREVIYANTLEEAETKRKSKENKK